MLNAGYKKEAIALCENAEKEYQRKYEEVVKNSTNLHGHKENAIVILKKIDKYVQSLSNKPKELEKIASEILIRRRAFEKEIEVLKFESMKVEKIGKSVAGAGAMAGAGVAAFGPSAAMSVATTFGTASTGTAIATLTGAAQTNAALAWLGGGTLATGGGGILGGEFFLSLAGPIGWTIGGVTILGSGIMTNNKNKKIAQKAEKQTKEIKGEIFRINKMNQKVCAEITAIVSLNKGVKTTLNKLVNLEYRDYKKFTNTDKDNLLLLMNSAETLSKRIGVKIS